MRRMAVRGSRLTEVGALERHDFRCEECGYGAVAPMAPEFCPMCRGSVWMLAGFLPAGLPRAPVERA